MSAMVGCVRNVARASAVLRSAGALLAPGSSYSVGDDAH
jgi:hypothetical protein